MNAPATKEQSPPTIAEGLADLARLFLLRHVSVGTISLTRNGATYEHVVQSAQQQDVTCTIEACARNVTIAISCLSRVAADKNAVLQSHTKWAAIAASDWTDSGSLLLEDNQQSCPPMIGISSQMQELAEEIKQAASSNHPVLLFGESGTGKTTAASAIHQYSARSKEPFVDLSCAAIPDTLLESELFGYQKGAFTGAVSTKPGLFETANKGSLFLDEIGELKLELQAKLLTAIEQQRTRRLGSTHYVKHDVRIIAASSRDLFQMIAEGTFREDLYYRLSVLEIVLPPLRERREDIPLLIRDRLIYEEQRSARPVQFTIQDSAITELTTYGWPGNIRQLNNVIARLCARAVDPCITRNAVRRELIKLNQQHHDSELNTIPGSIVLPADCRTLLPDESIEQFTRRIKRTIIETVIARTGSMEKTALRLAMHRSALSKLLSRLRETPTTALIAQPSPLHSPPSRKGLPVHYGPEVLKTHGGA